MDRVLPLADGRVQIGSQGAPIDATVSLMPTQALFNQQLVDHTFDCVEFPIATFVRLMEQERNPYIALPVFPSRHFRLSCVFVNRQSGITQPADLAGKRIGLPVFDMAAAVWLRGIFAEYYDLDILAPIYVSGGLEDARTGDEHPQYYPPQFTLEHRNDASLAQLLADGEIDALYTARAPSTWPSDTVTRLFDAPRGEELRYFQRSNIFPPMHVLALKRDIAEQHPEVIAAIYRAFGEAQRVARRDLWDSTALSTMLPWQLEALRESEDLLGGDPWPMGFAKNSHTIRTLMRYLYNDGLITTEFVPEDMFAGPEQDFLLST
ncbi:hypothetical protein [Microbacterium sp. NPDC076911]|uniref:hypothetical protein n=1 Tax=Microbacterium sp. NPDC076911 TaxID=3154958 RepID=UPI00344575F4